MDNSEMKRKLIRDIKNILNSPQENRTRPDYCEEIHDFLPILNDGGRMVRYYKCSKCGWLISTHNKDWYLRGVQHVVSDLLKYIDENNVDELSLALRDYEEKYLHKSKTM